MWTVDTPIVIRAIDDDAHGQYKKLPDAALLDFAQVVIQRLSTIARQEAADSGVDVDAFCKALIQPNPDDARMILTRAGEAGATHQELCVHYIAAAAGTLGAWWDDDRITFVDMSIAAGRMLQFLRNLRDLSPIVPQHGLREALFTTVPGEQHVLGVTMAADLMRDRGWKIDLAVNKSIEELSEIVRDGSYMIIGLSVTNADQLRTLASTIVELRIAAPHARIFIGGHLVAIEPDIAMRTGADAAADDIDACAQALEMLYQRIIAKTNQTP
ncbi:MAG TPA: cobalamin B12-binding domain-containing protein [Marivita sp.]|nr:cobalamin B12-binding domain-containing protein [Marivita sp.]